LRHGAEFVRTSAKRTHFTAHFVADRQIDQAIARARRFDDAALLSAGEHHRCNVRAVDGTLGTELLIAFKRRSMKVIWSSVSALIKSDIPIYKIISGTDFRTGWQIHEPQFSGDRT